MKTLLSCILALGLQTIALADDGLKIVCSFDLVQTNANKTTEVASGKDVGLTVPGLPGLVVLAQTSAFRLDSMMNSKGDGFTIGLCDTRHPSQRTSCTLVDYSGAQIKVGGTTELGFQFANEEIMAKAFCTHPAE